jgi:Na+-translocating ferredoxin:NAD+ oxidoreductase RnfC subunit
MCACVCVSGPPWQVVRQQGTELKEQMSGEQEKASAAEKKMMAQKALKGELKALGVTALQVRASGSQ